jgi:cellulose biosynthesis protein BcsQ
MLISAWADKGGGGKTTFAVHAAVNFSAKLLDLDPQADAARWAERAGHPFERLVLGAAATQARLVELAEAPELHVVDCPPGHDPNHLTGMAFARLVVVPTRSGDADLVALARALSVVRTVQQNGNPGLEVAVVLNSIRATGRSRGIAQGLRAGAGAYHYLGEIAERVAFEEAYSNATVVTGTAAEEVGAVMGKIRELLFPDAVHQHHAA